MLNNYHNSLKVLTSKISYFESYLNLSFLKFNTKSKFFQLEYYFYSKTLCLVQSLCLLIDVYMLKKRALADMCILPLL